MAKKINSCKKGKIAELEVTHLLKDHGFEARRGQQFSGGNESPDVISNLPLHIEVKRVEAFNLYKAVEQAKEDCKSHDYVVLHRKNKKEWVAILDAKTFLDIMGDYQLLKASNMVLLEEIVSLKEQMGNCDTCR